MCLPCSDQKVRATGYTLRFSRNCLIFEDLCIVGKNILFVTNNAKKSREMYKKAFDGFGIQASVVSLQFQHSFGNLELTNLFQLVI